MKHRFRAVTLLSLLSEMSYAQQELKGSDTMAQMTRAIIYDLGLYDQLNYTGGGTTLGLANTCQRFQAVSPASRLAQPPELDCAAQHSMELFNSSPIALDAVNVIVNDQGNHDLVNIKVTDVGNIYHCNYTTWDQVPTSTVGGPIRRYGRDGNAGTTHVFVSQLFWRDGALQQFPSLPNGDENYWEERFPCVFPIHGDGATLVLGEIAAADARAIVYSGGPALRDSDRALCVSDDVNFDPPRDPVCPGVATIEDYSYFWAYPLYYYFTDGPHSSAEWTLLNAVIDVVFPFNPHCAYLQSFVDGSHFYPGPTCYSGNVVRRPLE